MSNRARQNPLRIFIIFTGLLLFGCSSGSDEESFIEIPDSTTTVTTTSVLIQPEELPVSPYFELLPVKVKDVVYLRWTESEDLIELEDSRLIEISIDKGKTWSVVSGEQENFIRSGQNAVRVRNVPEATQHLFRISVTDENDEKIYSEVTPAASSCAAAGGATAELREKLSESFVGIADYEGFITADIPKSSAAILLAETSCLKSVSTHNREFMDSLGNHLLEWPDEYPSDKFGWGLPFSWDAFGDGTTNASNTVYSISTGIVVKALLDWAEVSDSDVQERVYEVVDKALQEWISPDSFTPLGQFAYSLSPYDKQNDVFNASAMLAGQMQRFYTVTESQNISYKDAADKVMQSLVDHHREEQISSKLKLQPGQSLEDVASNANLDLTELLLFNGYSQDNLPEESVTIQLPENIDSGWYWSYSSQELTPNDLTHAGYIVDGILSYIANDGSLASDFDEEKVLHHLKTFQSEGLTSHKLLGWPRWRLDELTRQEWRTPRLYDVGWSLYMSGKAEEQLETLRTAACSDGLSYQEDGSNYLKYPQYVNLESNSNPEIHEYMAYFYLGQVNSPCGYSFDLPQKPLKSNLTSVPFTSIGHSSEQTIGVLLGENPGASVIETEENQLSLPEGGIPVDFVQTGTKSLAVVRQWPSSALSFVSWDPTGLSTITDLPGQDNDVSLIFRKLVKGKDRLYIVVYDNAALENRLLVYSRDDLTLNAEIPLPSFKPEAGHTYEMEPPVFLLINSEGNLEVFAGTLHATLIGEELIENQLDACSKILEVKQGFGSTIGVLCEANDYFEQTWPDRAGGFNLVTLEGTKLEVAPIETMGVPLNLRYNIAEKIFIWDDSKDLTLENILRFELLAGQANGLLELGVNNREGRISWSQIYYLNAFLDLLDGTIHSIDGNGLLKDNFSNSLNRRLMIEVQALDQILCIDGYESLPFTVNREPATFAVQTSRVALLYERLLSYAPDMESRIGCIKEVAESSVSLEGHIEVLEEKGIPGWIEDGTSHLKWPKGSDFYFDGLNVPYNHQNEWALGVLKLQDRFEPDPTFVTAAKDILSYFYSKIIHPEDGVLPEDGRWPYWWGTAAEGWAATDLISTNMPSYAGDTGDAWISFRSIDSFAMLEWSAYLDQENQEKLVNSVAELIEHGQLLPQVTRGLPSNERDLDFETSTVGVFGRASSPAEIPEIVWVHALLKH